MRAGPQVVGLDRPDRRRGLVGGPDGVEAGPEREDVAEPRVVLELGAAPGGEIEEAEPRRALPPGVGLAAEGDVAALRVPAADRRPRAAGFESLPFRRPSGSSLPSHGRGAPAPETWEGCPEV